MFNKGLLLSNKQTGDSNSRYLLTVDKYSDDSQWVSALSLGFVQSQNMGSITPSTFLGSTLVAVAFTRITLGDTIARIAVAVNSEGIATAPIYVGFLEQKEYTAKLSEETNSNGESTWGTPVTATPSSAMYKLLEDMEYFLQAAKGSTIPIYLSATPPPWGYTE